jgi:hypothetical protein
VRFKEFDQVENDSLDQVTKDIDIRKQSCVRSTPAAFYPCRKIAAIHDIRVVVCIICSFLRAGWRLFLGSKYPSGCFRLVWQRLAFTIEAHMHLSRSLTLSDSSDIP